MPRSITPSSELRWDPRVEETEVGVEVDEGVVTLTGTVASLPKRVAREAAHRVLAVLDVANGIQVKIPGGLAWTDTKIVNGVPMGDRSRAVHGRSAAVDDHLRGEPV